MSPPGTSSFCAANTLLAFFRFGITVCFGCSRMNNTTAAITSGATIASHHGSHGFWR